MTDADTTPDDDFADPAERGEIMAAEDQVNHDFDPFATELAGDLSPPRPVADAATLAAPSLRALRDVPVRVQAVLGRAKMPISELIRLGPGSVIDLDRRIGEPVDILINDRLIARGEVVLIENQLGLTVTEIVRQDS